MKTSLTTLILSSILFTAINTSYVYRLIIIDNGFEMVQVLALNYPNISTKNFSILLFKIAKEDYQEPSEKNDFNEIKELPEYTGFLKYFYDDLNWELISTKSDSVNLKELSKNAFNKLCLPTESFNVKQNFFGEDREYSVDNTQNTETFQNGSIFPPFLGFFSQKNVGENTGFSVNMSSTQFSFLKNVYYIEDFESELEEIQISEFSVSKSTNILVVNWEDINVNLKIEEGKSEENLSKFQKKVSLKNSEEKPPKLEFLDKSVFNFGFQNTDPSQLTSHRNDNDDFANTIIIVKF